MSIPIRILHLSDFHFKNENNIITNNFNKNKLIDDLSQIKNEKNFDLVFITGDLIDKGGMSFDNIDEAFKAFEDELLTPLLHTLSIKKDQLFMVPGNHDIDTKSISEYIESGLCLHLETLEKVNSYVYNHNLKEYEGVKRIIPYKNFERKFYKDINVNNDNLFSTAFIKEINGIKIGIACINSAWRCNKEDDYGKLLIAQTQIDYCTNILDGAEIKIALTHHSLEFLTDFARRKIQSKFIANFDFHFVGHIHESTANNSQFCNGNLFTAVASSSTKSKFATTDYNYLNSYNYYDLDWPAKKLTLYSRIFIPETNKYLNNNRLLQDNNNKIFNLNFENINLVDAHSIVENIYDDFKEQINLDVISNSILSIAPSTLNEIFVEPNIEYYSDSNNEFDFDKKRNISLQEMIESTDNYILFGIKEIGKTVLLDKLAINYFDEIDKYHKVPIFFNFTKTKNSTSIETIISNFINKAKKDLPHFLNQNKIVLLIDDISFEDKYKIQKIETFLYNYPNIQIICCSLLKVEGSIPENYYNSKLSNKLKVLNLKYYKTKQIKALTENWFSKDTFSNKETKPIIKLMQKLELPRTPLAISMFLWIYEKDQNYQPINYAVLLEQFIEKMFERNSNNELSYDKFDFKNKISILTKLARKMYEGNNINYALSYTKVLKIFVTHLKERSFNFDAKNLINYFQNIGLFNNKLENSETFISFRFTCIFQYFLMKNIDDADFYKYVLKEENYLAFSDEINYYTGLKRNNLEILKLIILRMETNYVKLTKDLTVPKNDFFDLCYDKKRSIAEQINPNIDFHSKKKEIQDNELSSMDNYLESQDVSEKVTKKENSFNNLEKLERQWLLASNVLRNSDEIDQKEEKYNAFIKILHSSIFFFCITKLLLLEKLSQIDDKDNEKNKAAIYLYLDLLPIVLQMSLKDNLLSSKLELIISKHINTISTKKEISELEKIITVLLYNDIKGDKYRNKVTKIISACNKKYSYDFLLMKFFILYIESTTENEESFYIDCILTVINKSKNNKLTNKLKFTNKLKIFKNKFN